MKFLLKRGIKHLFVILILGYIVSVTFFSHTHEIRGEKIIHSHFCFPFGETQHNHSENEILVITSLSQLITTVVFGMVFYQILLQYRTIRNQFAISKHFPDILFLSSNAFRAPPFYSTFFVFR